MHRSKRWDKTTYIDEKRSIGCALSRANGANILTYRRGSGPPIQSTPSPPPLSTSFFAASNPLPPFVKRTSLNTHFPLRSFSRFPPPFARGDKGWPRSWYISCAFFKARSWKKRADSREFEGFVGIISKGTDRFDLIDSPSWISSCDGISISQRYFPFDQNYSEK